MLLRDRSFHGRWGNRRKDSLEPGAVPEEDGYPWTQKWEFYSAGLMHLSVAEEG